MKTRKLIGVSALALLVAVTVAQTIGGKGVILANGTGTTQIQGDGKFALHGKGSITVFADGEDDIKVEGFQITKRTGDLKEYTGEGAISINGSKVRIEAEGELESIRIIGHGEATFKGKGQFRGGGTVTDWSAKGSTVAFGKKQP